MKISAGENITCLGEHQRVVGRAASFGLNNSPRVLERVAHRAVNLRHATQTVSVLYARIVFQVRLANLATGEQRPQMSGDRDLTRVWSRRVNAFIKCDRSSLLCFERHGAGNVCQVG